MGEAARLESISAPVLAEEPARSCELADTETPSSSKAEQTESTARPSGGERDLRHARFVGQDLQGADFRSCDLRGASFCGSDLRCADFTGAQLMGCRFSACNLSGATIDIEAAIADQLKAASELSATASRTLLTLLTGCLFVWLTIGKTTDTALVMDDSTLPLPVVSMDLPIVGFYLLAPFVLFSIFLYLQLSLQRLWETLSELPAYLPSGKTADRTTDTWFFSGMLQANFKKLRKDRRVLTVIENGLTLFLIWMVAPITIAEVWLSYLPRRHAVGTALILLAFALAALSASLCFWKAAQTLQPDREKPLTLIGGAFYCVPSLLAILALAALSVQAFDGPPSNIATRFLDPTPGAQSSTLGRLAASALTFIGYRNYATLANAHLSTTHDASAPITADGIPPEVIALSGPWLPLRDLRGLYAPHLYAPHSNLRSALLDNAELWQADLRLSLLNGASAAGIDLTQATLSYANLRKAQLDGARLQNLHADRICALGASFAGASLDNADLSEANLTDADFTGASVSGLKLTGADLSSTIFTRALGLNAETLKGACGTSAIGLPDGLTLPHCASPPKDWCKVLTPYTN